MVIDETYIYVHTVDRGGHWLSADLEYYNVGRSPKCIGNNLAWVPDVMRNQELEKVLAVMTRSETN